MDYGNLMKAYNKLGDEESCRWFDARVDYALNKNIYSWWEMLHNNCQSWEFGGADVEFLSANFYKGKKIVIFGAGAYGKHALFILSHSVLSQRVAAFIDNQLCNTSKIVMGFPVWAPSVLMKSPDDYVVVIGSGLHALDMYKQLCFMGFPQCNIYIPREGRFVGYTGHQYYDLFSPIEGEIFIDAGCYDGETSCAFLDWCHGNYEHIYAFEPTPEMAEVARENFQKKRIEKFDLQEAVCWSKSGRVRFSISTIRSASFVSGDDGDMKAVSIDDILQGNPVTFIKMDVEGSEMEALRGAAESIQRYKPRLAISLYHKPEDIFEIPSYIISLNHDYKLYIRHYTSDIWETVLYAI